MSVVARTAVALYKAQTYLVPPFGWILFGATFDVGPKAFGKEFLIPLMILKR